MNIKDYDMVEVVKDVPQKNIKSGMRGMVIDVFNKPNLAYEVEFCDNTGMPAMQTALLPDQVMKLENFSAERYIKEGGARLYLLSDKP